MENIKKGSLFKAIFTAIAIAAFCFVIGLCVNTKSSSRVEAGASPTAASNFTAEFNLNKSMSKTLSAQSSTIYGGYSFLKNNEVSIDMNYIVDCTTYSDEANIKAQIDSWNKHVEFIEESIGMYILCGPLMTLILKKLTSKYNQNIADMSAKEQGDLVAENWMMFVGELVAGFIGYASIALLLKLIAKIGLCAVPVIGWIIAIYTVITAIASIILLVITAVKAENLKQGLQAGAHVVYNYCANAYEYMSNYNQNLPTERDENGNGILDESEELDVGGFDYARLNGEIGFTNYQKIATNQQVKYGEFYYRKAVEHRVSGYVLQLEVIEVNERAAPTGYDSWTDFFFPGYISKSKNPLVNGLSIAPGDRTEALFCSNWDEARKICNSDEKSYVSNTVTPFSFNVSYGKDTPQYKLLAQGLYSFEFTADMVHVGSNSKSLFSATDETPIYVSNNDAANLDMMYGMGGTFKYGIYEALSSTVAKEECLGRFSYADYKVNEEDEEYMDWNGSYDETLFGFARIISKGTNNIVYCKAPKQVTRKRNIFGFKEEINWEKVEFEAYRGTGSWDALAQIGISEYVEVRYKWESADYRARMKTSIYYDYNTYNGEGDYNGPYWEKFQLTDMNGNPAETIKVNKSLANFVQQATVFGNRETDDGLEVQRSTIYFIIDQTNPYQPQIGVKSGSGSELKHAELGEDSANKELYHDLGYYSNDSVVLNFSRSEAYSIYAENEGDAIAHYGYAESWQKPFGVDGKAPGSGISEYMYAVFKNEDIDIDLMSSFSRFMFEINHNNNYGYKFCVNGSINKDSGALSCSEYSYGFEPTLAQIKYGDTRDWLDLYEAGIDSKFEGSNSAQQEFNTISIPKSKWKTVPVTLHAEKGPLASSETFTEEGIYYIFVVAKDFAGNVGAASAVKFMIDKTRPQIDLQTYDVGGASIYDAKEQIEFLKDEYGYIEDGYVITKTSIKMINIVMSDKGLYSSGIRKGTSRANYKVCISYLGTVDDSTCLSIYTDGSISGPDVAAPFAANKPLNATEIDTEVQNDYFDYGFKVFRDSSNYVISYILTDEKGDIDSGGSPSGVFRLSVFVQDEVGNATELKMLFISSVETWEVEPEAETIIQFDFGNADNPISKLDVELHFPIYYINKESKKVLNLRDLLEAKYMLVNSSDRVKFYTDWYKYLAICTNDPNDIRCGRKVDELKDRFINIEPSSDIINLLRDDTLYENYYVFQHFQIKIPYKKDNSSNFYYVIIQEFEFSTSDLISQLAFVKDEHDKEIGNNLLDPSLELLSTSNSEIRLKYTDYSEFIRDSEVLSNFNFVDQFNLNFDLMQLAIDNPVESKVKVPLTYNLKFKLNVDGDLNTNQSAGDFKWLPDDYKTSTNWIYNFTQNYVTKDENGNLCYYFYIDLREFATEYDIGVTYAINNVNMSVTKNNAFLGSTPDFSSVISAYFTNEIDWKKDVLAGMLETSSDSEIMSALGLTQIEKRIGLLEKITSDKYESGLFFDLNIKTWDDLKASEYFKFYYYDNGRLVEVASKRIVCDPKSTPVISYNSNEIYAFIPLYIYFEELHVLMNSTDLNAKYRFDDEVVLEYQIVEDKLTKYKSAGASAIFKDGDTYKFSSNNAEINGKDVYIGFYNSYIDVSSPEMLKLLLNAALSTVNSDNNPMYYIEVADAQGNKLLRFNNFYVKTIGNYTRYGLVNSYSLLNIDPYLTIYSNSEYSTTVNDPNYIPSTGKFNFAEAMGVTPTIYAEKRDFYSDVYWTNSMSLSFEITNFNYYEYAYIFGPSLKYQYGVIPTEKIDLINVIALYAHYNSIDLMDWFTCVDATSMQCLSGIETIKNSILSEYYNKVSDGFKNKIDTYLGLNNVPLSSLNREILIEIGAYSLDYQNAVSKAFVTSTKTLFNMISNIANGANTDSKITLEKAKEQFILDKFRDEINERNSVLDSIEANKDYYYKNYYFDSTSGDFKYMVANTLTMQDLYASALSLYMSNLSETNWRNVDYCYESTLLSPCTSNSTGLIDATDLLGDITDNEYVIVYRVVDSLGRTSLNYKVIHYFTKELVTPIPTMSEIILTDTNTFYSINTGEATLNLTNLQNYMFGSESFDGYISTWFTDQDEFYKNVVDRKLCIVKDDGNCTTITNDEVIAMQIGQTYTFKFTLTDKAGNVLEFSAPFQLIYDVAPTFDISIENPNVYETNKNVNVVVQYRSVAGLDYDRSLTSITLGDGEIIDAANGVFYLDLSDYGYSATAGINKNGAIVVGKKVIDIYSDINGKEYSEEFIAFLDGVSFKNNLLIGENGYYLNVNKENGTFIMAANMTKPIRSSVNELGRSRVYSSIVSVPNIDITAPQVAFDNQFKDQRDMVDGNFYFSSQSVILYFKDFNGVGISDSNLSYVSVKPVYDSEVCTHDDVECIAAAMEMMSTVPALSQNIENGYIWVDVTPNLTRMGLTTYYVSVKDDLNNAAFFRYDIQLDTIAPIVDVEETYIKELDENGFSRTSNITIVFNSSKNTTSEDKSYEVASPLEKIVISEKEINSSATPIETVRMCEGKCDTTMEIPYQVQKEKVNLTLSLYDVAGNKSTDFVMTVTIDNLVPDLTIEVRSDTSVISNKPVNVLVVATDNFSFFDGTFEDENGILHYDIEVMRDNSGVWERINNNYEYVIKENGIYRFRANDMAKNFIEHEIEITNIDNKAPTLTFTPDGGPEAQSHTINMKIEEDLSYLSVINYCWVTTNSNITECNETVPGYVSNKISSNQTIKEISVTQNTGENANPDGEYVMIVYVSDEWGNGKTYISKPYLLNSKKPSITPNQALVSDSTVAVIDETLSAEVGHTVYVSELAITDSNNIAHLLSDKAMVTITGEATKELIGQWVTGFGGTALSTPVTFDNIFVTDGANGDYYYLRFSTTYEDSNKELQTAIVYLVVHVVDKSIPEITLISGATEIEVNKTGEDYVIPGVSIRDINEGTLYENSALRSVYFFPYGQYVPTIEELEADMVLTTHQYIKYESNTEISIKTIGTYLVYYVVTDGSGNSASALRRIDIIDEVAPTITLENPLVVENFIYVKEEGKQFNIRDFAFVGDNYDDLTAENVDIRYEYKSEGGTYVQHYYEEGKLQTLGYHKFTYTLIDTSGNVKEISRVLHTVNVEIKYLNGEQAGSDVSLNENDSFIIKGGIRIKTNNLRVLINDKPIETVATQVNVSGEIYYEYSANGKQNLKVIDDMENEVVYSLYMIKIDDLNPEEQEELKVLIDKTLVTSTKQIVASSSDFTPNTNSNDEIVSYTIFLHNYNINIDGSDAFTEIDGEKVNNSIVFALFCDNVLDNNGVKCSTNYLELTLEGKTLNTSSTIQLTETLDAITISVAEYNNMVANGNRLVMLVVTEDQAKKIETYVPPVVEGPVLSKSSMSSVVLFGVPSVIGLVAILRVLKFKKSVKTV